MFSLPVFADAGSFFIQLLNKEYLYLLWTISSETMTNHNPNPNINQGFVF